MLIQGGATISGRSWTCLGRRVVLNQLHHVVAENDFALRRADVFTDLERIGVDQRDTAFVIGQIFRRVFPALDQILAAGAQRFLDDFGIEERHVRGAHHVAKLFCEKLCAALGALVDVGRVDRVQESFGDQQIGLLERIERRVFGPCGVRKTAVAGFR